MEKVKVGQVWSNGNLNFTISRVNYDAQIAYCIDKRECEFGSLTKEGYPYNWDGWKLVKTEVQQQSKIEMKSNVDILFAFFSQPHPGECVCGLVKEFCEYHRGT